MIVDFGSPQVRRRTTLGGVGEHVDLAADASNRFGVLTHLVHDRKGGLLGQSLFGDGKLKLLNRNRIDRVVIDQNFDYFGSGVDH